VYLYIAMIVKRRSRIQGWGVYATRIIPKNKRIIYYAGEKISNQESLRRERRYIKRGHIWCFKLTNRSVIDAGVGGNIARFINHSCRPNCYVEIADGTIWIRAARTIRRGEELTYQYNTDGEGLIACRCRAGCQTLL
jgi:SET domain-containing protein